jgi:NAD(P)H-flavin reductase/hemoglobin-like flavoprotein
MARRADSTATSTIVPPDGGDAPKPQHGQLAWWRLRSWRKDVDVLSRVREGLQNLPDSAGEDDAPASELPQPDESVPPGTSAEAPSQPADPAIVAIRHTFARVAAAGDDAAAYFYARLFVRSPELRGLFPPAMDEQRDRLFRALARIVESLSSPEDLAGYLTQLGRDHRKYSVEPSMYDTVGAALVATLRKFAGADFTAAAEEAWVQTYTAASALMIRAAEDDSAAGPAYWKAEVVEHEKHDHGIAMLTLAPDEPLRYEAGQHLTVQTPRWPHVWRPYSIACRPREDGLIRLHVKAVPGGWVSNALVHHTLPGDEVILGPALGTMTLGPAENRDLLCIAGGTGLSPLKAIAEQAVRESAAGRHRQIFMFYGARCREELYDLRDLWRLSDAYPGFQLTPVTSDDPAFEGMQGNVGRVAARYMRHKDCEAYVAGPPSMVRETVRVLTKAGIARERIHFDDALLAGHERVGSGT